MLLGRIQRCALVALFVPIVVPATGCSLLFVTPPKADVRTQGSAEADRRTRELEAAKCTSSRAAPVLDLLMTGFQAYRTATAVNTSESAYENAPINRDADILIGAALFATFLGSSAWGFKATARCNKLNDVVNEESSEPSPTKRDLAAPHASARRLSEIPAPPPPVQTAPKSSAEPPSVDPTPLPSASNTAAAPVGTEKTPPSSSAPANLSDGAAPW